MYIYVYIYRSGAEHITGGSLSPHCGTFRNKMSFTAAEIHSSDLLTGKLENYLLSMFAATHEEIVCVIDILKSCHAKSNFI